MEKTINYDSLLLHTINSALVYETSSTILRSLENVDVLKGLQSLLMNNTLKKLDDKTLLH
jgi:hypothetical protein